MARLLPADAPPPIDPTAARLEALLASLPDEWTLIPDRRIGGRDGPPVGFVLLHPDIGIALVDLVPAHPEDAIRPLVGLLAEQDLDAGDLPVVAVTVAADELEAVGQRLAAAFESAPPCSVDDRYWPERVSGLVLAAEDAAMAPIPKPAPLQPAFAEWRPTIDPEDAISHPMQPAPRVRRSLIAAGVVAITLAGLGLGAAIDFVTRQPKPAETASVGISPEPPATAPRATPRPSLPTAAPEATLAAPQPQAVPPEKPPAATAAPATPTPPVPVEKPTVAEAQPAPPVTPAPPSPAANPAPPVATPLPPTQADSAAPPKPAASQAPAVDTPPPSKTNPPAAAAPVRPAAEAAPPPSANPAARAPQTRPVAVKPPPKPLKSPPVKTAEAKPTPPRTAPPVDETDGPPIDASDLPPLEGTTRPTPPEPVNQVATLPAGAPVPLPTPYGGPPAPGQPIMLLPPVAPPAAMPPPPAFGAGIEGNPGRY